VGVGVGVGGVGFGALPGLNPALFVENGGATLDRVVLEGGSGARLESHASFSGCTIRGGEGGGSCYAAALDVGAVSGPLRPFWRPFCLRFTYVPPVLVTKC
jgi:hypothetical protein